MPTIYTIIKQENKKQAEEEKKKNKENSNKKVKDNIMKVDRTNTIRCVRCGKYYINDGNILKMCRYCRIKDKEDFEKVRAYLYKNNIATAIEIEENTGVSVNQIDMYLKNGRLEIPKNSPIFIKCEECGAEIRYGRFCPACSARLSKEISGRFVDDSQIGELAPKKAKMYHFGKEQKESKDKGKYRNKKNGK